MRDFHLTTLAANLLIVTATCGILRADTIRSVSVPFPVAKAVADSSGQRMFVWQTSPHSQIAIIDLAQDSLVASTKVDHAITAIAFSAYEPAQQKNAAIAALAVSEQEAVLYILDATNLQVLQRKEVPVSSNSRFLIDSTLTFEDDSLRIATQGGAQIVFTYPDLVDIPQETPPTSPANGRTPSVPSDNATFSKWRGFIHLGAMPEMEVNHRASRSLQLKSLLYRPTEIQDPDRYTPQRGIPHQNRRTSISIRLATVLNRDATMIDLVAENASRQEIARWQISELVKEERNRNLNVTYSLRGNWVTIVLNGQVYLQGIERVEKLAPPRFQLSLEEEVSVPQLRDSLQLEVDVQGGFKPYAVHVQLVNDETEHPQVFIDPIEVDPYRYNLHLSSYIRHNIASFGEAIVYASDRTATAEALLEQYKRSCQSQFETIAGRRLSHVPFAIPLVVVARDAEGVSQTLAAHYLIEIPESNLFSSVNRAIQTRWPGTSVASEAANSTATPSSSYTSLVDFSSLLRSKAINDRKMDELESHAERALQASNSRWQAAWGRAQQELRFPRRTWNAASNEAYQARFKGLFAGHAILETTSDGRRFALVESMSEADQGYVQSAMMDLGKPIGNQHAERVRFELLATAIEKFADSSGKLPPLALGNDEGQPILSWRVLLLPYVGASELYSLFRLDEPWDSAHNRILLNYMPDIYRTPASDRLGSQGTTSLMRIVGDRTASPMALVLEKELLAPENRHTLLVIRTKAEVPWSAPLDTDIVALAKPNASVRWQASPSGGLTYGIMCDGSVQAILESSSSQAWTDACLLDNPGTELLKTKQE